MGWNNTLVLVKETRHCKVCEESREHWKIDVRIGGVTKFMTYTGAVAIPLMMKMANSTFPFQCSVCNPLRIGAKVKMSGYGKIFPAGTLKGKRIEKLIRDGVS